MNNSSGLNETILDLLVPNPSRNIIGIAASLDPTDWEYVLVRGKEHRFLPMMNWTLSQCAALENVPLSVRQALAETNNQQALRALTVQRELLVVHRVLYEADVAHVFLKGAFLAQVIYPNPGLRPLRDIDVAVRPQDAQRAQIALVNAGYIAQKEAPGMIAAYIEQKKHLPGLVSPSKRMKIELHVRVGEPDGVLAGLDPFRNTIRHKLGCEMPTFMDPTDLLIHLCVHSANFHWFNNGPLIVADIGFLLQHTSLDTKSIMKRAAELGVIKSVGLVIALTESCWGRNKKDLSLLTDTVSPEVVRIARRLCLRSFEERANVDFFVNLSLSKSRPESIRRLVHKLFPSRKQLALEFGFPESETELPWLYARHFHLLLRKRIPELIRGYTMSTLNAEVENVRQLKAWLET